MALKDTWKPRVDGVDDADSSAVNEIAEAVIQNENDIEQNKQDISEKANVSDVYYRGTIDAMVEAKADIYNVYYRGTIDAMLGDKVDTVIFNEKTEDVLKSCNPDKVKGYIPLSENYDATTNKTTIVLTSVEGLEVGNHIAKYIVAEPNPKWQSREILSIDTTTNTIIMHAKFDTQISSALNENSSLEDGILVYGDCTKGVIDVQYGEDMTLVKAYVDGDYNTYGFNANVEGNNNEGLAISSHTEGDRNITTGISSHNEGSKNNVSGKYAHGEGMGNKVAAENSHGEGATNTLTVEAKYAHVEGWNNVVSGYVSHGEGIKNKVSGRCTHGEGYNNEVTGQNAHVEGANNIVSGQQAHGEGMNTIASSNQQHVQGKFNVADTQHKYAHIVGGGTSEDNRKNIHTIDWSGNAEFAGTIKSNGKLVATEEYVKNYVEETILGGAW